MLILKDFKNLVYEVNSYLDLDSGCSNELLLGTCAVESDFGTFRRQQGYAKNSIKGAFGIYQIELLTHNYLVNSFLKVPLKERVESFFDNSITLIQNLMFNDRYATAIARLKYYSCPFDMPSKNANIEEMAEIWKRWYNTKYGNGTTNNFIYNYKKYILGKTC